MKKLILTAILGMTTVGVFGQGQVVMNAASVGMYMKFYDTVTLANLTGANVNVGLYWGTSVNDLATGGGTLATFADMNSTAAGAGTYPGVANVSATGLLNSPSGGGNRFTSMAQAGVTTYFQLRAWTGAYATYDAAVASGLSSVHVSHFANADAPIVGFTTTANITPAPTPANITWPGGASSAAAVLIDLYPVPEPSTFALAGLGLFGLYFIRRRK